MNTPRQKIPALIISLAFSFIISAQGTSGIQHHEFSIQQAIEYARKNNMRVKNALLGVEVQKEMNKEITAAAYPQINGSFNIIDNIKLPVSLVPAEFFGGTPGTYEKFPFGVKWNSTGGIELNQLLFEGQLFVGLQARKTSIDFQLKNAEVTEELIKANIYKIYYQLVVSSTQIELLDANIVRLEKLLHDTKEIYKNGFAEKLDVDKVIVQLSNLQTEKLKALTLIENGYLGLKLLMGMPIRDELVLTDSLSYDEVREDILVQSTPYSYNDRKEYQYAELGRRLNEYNIKRYRLSRIPTLSLNGYYNKNAQRNKFDFLKSGGDWFSISAITLRVSVPIFNGFATRAKIAQAQLALQQSVNEMDNLKLTIDNEVETARSNFRSAIATLENQKRNIDLAEQVYNQTKKKYESGLGSNLEITVAQSELRVAQANYVTAMYDAIIAHGIFSKQQANFNLSMTNKLNNMNIVLKTLGVLLLVLFFQACGNSRKEEAGKTTDKKVKLEKLKSDQKKLNQEIAALEAEIAKSDTTSGGGNAKLVAVIALVPQSFTHYIELQGKVDAENISYVSPRGGPGLVKAIYVKDGDFVKKGQLLLKLDDAVMLQNLNQLESQLAFAKDIYKRQKNLWDQGIGTEVQFVTAKNNVDQIERQISTLKETWNLTFVRAETSGIADEVNIHVGETFTGSPMQGIKIINTSSLKVVTDVPENYMSKVRKGTPVEVVIPDLNNRLINSTISLISQSINPNSRGFQAEAKIPYDAHLKPNQVAIVKIQDYGATNAVVVPVNIIQTDEKGKYTYVLVDEKGKKVARKRRVMVGEIYGEQIEIKQGLTAGEQIIIQGYQGLYDDQLVTTES